MLKYRETQGSFLVSYTSQFYHKESTHGQKYGAQQKESLMAISQRKLNHLCSVLRHRAPNLHLLTTSSLNTSDINTHTAHSQDSVKQVYTQQRIFHISIQNNRVLTKKKKKNPQGENKGRLLQIVYTSNIIVVWSKLFSRKF